MHRRMMVRPKRLPQMRTLRMVKLMKRRLLPRKKSQRSPKKRTPQMETIRNNRISSGNPRWRKK